MNAQKILFALLQLHKSNFQLLHWKVCGRDFDNMHNNVTNSYYEKTSSDIDDVAEVILRQGINPPNYAQVLGVLKEGEIHTNLLSGDATYTKQDVTIASDKMLGEICTAIIAVLNAPEMKNPENIGIKSYYENLLNEYDKEFRFLNKHRLEDKIVR